MPRLDWQFGNRTMISNCKKIKDTIDGMRVPGAELQPPILSKIYEFCTKCEKKVEDRIIQQEQIDISFKGFFKDKFTFLSENVINWIITFSSDGHTEQNQFSDIFKFIADFEVINKRLLALKKSEVIQECVVAEWKLAVSRFVNLNHAEQHAKHLDLTGKYPNTSDENFKTSLVQKIAFLPADVFNYIIALSSDVNTDSNSFDTLFGSITSLEPTDKRLKVLKTMGCINGGCFNEWRAELSRLVNPDLSSNTGNLTKKYSTALLEDSSGIKEFFGKIKNRQKFLNSKEFSKEEKIILLIRFGHVNEAYRYYKETNKKANLHTISTAALKYKGFYGFLNKVFPKKYEPTSQSIEKLICRTVPDAPQVLTNLRDGNPKQFILGHMIDVMDKVNDGNLRISNKEQLGMFSGILGENNGEVLLKLLTKKSQKNKYNSITVPELIGQGYDQVRDYVVNVSKHFNLLRFLAVKNNKDISALISEIKAFVTTNIPEQNCFHKYDRFLVGIFTYFVATCLYGKATQENLAKVWKLNSTYYSCVENIGEFFGKTSWLRSLYKIGYEDSCRPTSDDGQLLLDWNRNLILPNGYDIKEMVCDDGFLNLFESGKLSPGMQRLLQINGITLDGFKAKLIEFDNDIHGDINGIVGKLNTSEKNMTVFLAMVGQKTVFDVVKSVKDFKRAYGIVGAGDNDIRIELFMSLLANILSIAPKEVYWWCKHHVQSHVSPELTISGGLFFSGPLDKPRDRNPTHIWIQNGYLYYQGFVNCKNIFYGSCPVPNAVAIPLNLSLRMIARKKLEGGDDISKEQSMNNRGFEVVSIEADDETKKIFNSNAHLVDYAMARVYMVSDNRSSSEFFGGELGLCVALNKNLGTNSSADGNLLTNKELAKYSTLKNREMFCARESVFSDDDKIATLLRLGHGNEAWRYMRGRPVNAVKNFFKYSVREIFFYITSPVTKTISVQELLNVLESYRRSTDSKEFSRVCDFVSKAMSEINVKDTSRGKAIAVRAFLDNVDNLYLVGALNSRCGDPFTNFTAQFPPQAQVVVVPPLPQTQLQIGNALTQNQRPVGVQTNPVDGAHTVVPPVDGGGLLGQVFVQNNHTNVEPIVPHNQVVQQNGAQQIEAPQLVV